MTNYMKWLVRSRIMAFTGFALIFVAGSATFHPTLVPFVLQGRTAGIIAVLGACLLIVGVLDGFGLIRRSWVKAAIREENERMRSGR